MSLDKGIYSCNYPIWHKFQTTGNNPITYTVLLNGEEVYSGQVVPFNPSDTTVEIDISEVCREYLDTSYENMERLRTSNGIIRAQMPASGVTSSSHIFTISSPNNMATDYSEVEGDENNKEYSPIGGDVSYLVVYDYNTDYESVLGVMIEPLDPDDPEYPGEVDENSGHFYRNLNNPMFMQADPRQRLWLCGYLCPGSLVADYSSTASLSLDGFAPEPGELSSGEPFSGEADFIEAAGFYLFVNGTRQSAYDYTPLSRIDAKQGIYVLSVDLRKLYERGEIEPGDKVSLALGGETHVYEIAKPCLNRFVLYYVNKAGGMDSLLCSGRTNESFSASNTDARLYADRGSRMSWEQKRLYTEIEKTYDLNTGLMEEELASKIDELIFSPKVLIHDLNNDTITPCLITNSTCTLKTQRYDRLQYKIKVKESKKYIRR